MGKWMGPEMADMIRELYDAGFREDMIAERCNIPLNKVRRAITIRDSYSGRTSETYVRKPRGFKPKVDYEALRLIASTEYHTLEDLGKRFGVTRERIRQILAGMTYDRKRINRKPPPPINVVSEFLRWVGGAFNPDDRCVSWRGPCSHDGIPRVYIGNGKSNSARNFIFRLYGGFLVANSTAFNTCETGLCVNPYHMDTSLNRNIRNAPQVSYAKRPCHFRKLNENSVTQIKAQLMSGERARSIAPRYGVRYGSILNIRRGHTWRHVPWPGEETQ